MWLHCKKVISPRRHGGHGENSGSSQRNFSPNLTFFFLRALCASVLKVFSVQPYVSWRSVAGDNCKCQMQTAWGFAPVLSCTYFLIFSLHFWVRDLVD